MTSPATPILDCTRGGGGTDNSQPNYGGEKDAAADKSNGCEGGNRSNIRMRTVDSRKTTSVESLNKTNFVIASTKLSSRHTEHGRRTVLRRPCSTFFTRVSTLPLFSWMMTDITGIRTARFTLDPHTFRANSST